MTSVEAALREAVGHPGPHTDAELAAVTDLTVVHPDDLAPLARCTGLRRLTLIAGDVTLPAADPGPGPGLERLRLVACRVRDPDGLLGGAVRSWRRDLLFCAFPDLDANDGAVLLAAAGGTVAGVPHSRSVAEYRAELTDDASEYERRQCVRLWERTGAVFGAGLLVRPGPPALTEGLIDAVRISAAELELELDTPGFSLEGLFRRYPHDAAGLPALLARVAEPPGARLLRWAAAAELWPDDRLGVERFAQRYPGARLCTDPRPVLDAAAALHRALVPFPFLLRPKLAKWLLLRYAPALCLGRFPGRAWLVGLSLDPPEPDDMLLALGYLVIGRAVPHAGGVKEPAKAVNKTNAVRTVTEPDGEVLAVTLDDAERIVRLDLAACRAVLAGRPSPFPALRDGAEPPVLGERAYRSYRELLDDVTGTSFTGGPGAPRSTEDGSLPREVRLELRRLGLVYKGRSTVDPAGLAELLAGLVSRPGGA